MKEFKLKKFIVWSKIILNVFLCMFFLENCSGFVWNVGIIFMKR